MLAFGVSGIRGHGLEPAVRGKSTASPRRYPPGGSDWPKTGMGVSKTSPQQYPERVGLLFSGHPPKLIETAVSFGDALPTVELLCQSNGSETRTARFP